MDIKNLSTHLKYKVYQRLFINHCYLCNVKSDKTLCDFCRMGLTNNLHACPICQRPNPTEQGLICGQCQAHPPNYDACIAPLCFSGITKNLIHAIKFHQQAHYIKPLIERLKLALISHYQDDRVWPSQLIFVPSHSQRIKERGFCQTQLMARELHRTLLAKNLESLPELTLTRALHKAVNTQAQHTLSRKKRLESPNNIYQIHSVVDQHIALFDDVMTSGSTIESCTKLLKKAGAKQVDVWLIARTPDKTE